MSDDIVILSGARTAIGTFGGALAATPPTKLGSTVAAEAMARACVSPEQIGHVVFGNVSTPSRVTCTSAASPRATRACPTRCQR